MHHPILHGSIPRAVNPLKFLDSNLGKGHLTNNTQHIPFNSTSPKKKFLFTITVFSSLFQMTHVRGVKTEKRGFSTPNPNANCVCCIFWERL